MLWGEREQNKIRTHQALAAYLARLLRVEVSALADLGVSVSSLFTLLTLHSTHMMQVDTIEKSSATVDASTRSKRAKYGARGINGVYLGNGWVS
jgi:hypothetical protein